MVLGSSVRGGDGARWMILDVFAVGFPDSFVFGGCASDLDFACEPCLKRCRMRPPRGIVSNTIELFGVGCGT